MHGSIPGLARLAGVSVEDCEQALNMFKQPDIYSRSQEHEGRRIQDIEGGWLLLNYGKYREMMDVETVKESKRNWAKRNRDKSKIIRVQRNGVEPVAK